MDLSYIYVSQYIFSTTILHNKKMYLYIGSTPPSNSHK